MRSTQSTVVAENVQGLYLDEELFASSFRSMKKSSAAPVSDEEASKLEVLDATQKGIASKHSDNIASSILSSLPGDHYRNLDWNISNVTKATTSLLKTPEFEAEISYNGKTYKKHAFPFGKMEIGGDKIKNEVSLEAIIGDMKSKLNKKNKRLTRRN